MIQFIALSTSLSLLMIYFGAKNTMTGAINLGNNLQLQKAVTGSILVATVTALPELSSSLFTAVKGAPNMALGNVLGTNIYNLPLLVGLVGLFGDVEAVNGITRQCAYLLGVNVFISALVITFHSIQPWMGPLFIVIYFGFISDSLRNSGRSGATGLAGQLPTTIFPLLAGAVILVLGSYLLVDGALWVMNNYSLGSFMVGLLMSFGPIIPELAVSLLSSASGEHEVSFGNILGDNIITSTLVLGILSLTAPISVSITEFAVTIPFTILFTILVLILSKLRIKITRRLSILMLLLTAATFLLQFSVLS